ncbi:MAG: hypothetical protein UY52_C0006G0014 [Parcubacteria group bacterium GW2011_GWC2_49_9]|nr:MAG: hypothetical protein UY34_C0001G0031 [Parcubacteria group bacterium GW2011_GWA2_48_9]KKW16333.1 MAG: hypothetical protein UY52_C0006G0014 [Parcubacteria group bacterium GW2011_GWC2_49_9]
MALLRYTARYGRITCLTVTASNPVNEELLMQNTNKVVLKGTVLTAHEVGALKTLGPGIWLDDAHSCDVRLIAVMPSEQVVDLGTVDVSLAEVGRGDLLKGPYRLEDGTEVCISSTVTDFTQFLIET